MRDVLRHLIDLLKRDREVLCCQVIETKGSTPQKAGAMMVVDPDGGQVGTLGGGCVENEVKLKALRQLDREGAELHSFLLDHDYAWADGLICGGKMVVLTEALRGPDALAYYEAYLALLDAGDGLTEAIVTDPARAGGHAVGSRFLFDAAGRLAAAVPPARPSSSVEARIEPVDARPRPSGREGLATMSVLPRIRLVIVGAGHVGQAVAGLAAQADFDLCIVDDRRQYANAERFPDAGEILVGPIDEILGSLTVTPRTYALIVTRGHGHDQEALYHLAPTAASYVGLIGSRRKIRMIFEALREQGVAEADLARASAPVGLEIGSQTVPEIAISIVAELIARRNLGSVPNGSTVAAAPEEIGA